jgi:transposase-like protein
MAETRRTFTREYKLSAVKLVTEQGRSFSEAARSLGISAELLRRWTATFAADGAHGELFRKPEKRVGPRRGLPHPSASEGEHLRVHRGLVQPGPQTLETGLPLAGRFRSGTTPITLNSLSVFRGELQMSPTSIPRRVGRPLPWQRALSAASSSRRQEL